MRRLVDQLRNKRAGLVTTTQIAETELKQRTELVIDYETASQIAQEVSKTMQAAVHSKISKIVTRCLAAVFDDPYEFQIKFETKRDRTEAVITLVRDGLEVDPVTATGGGVVDVAAFALRLAALSLTRPQLRRCLIMDEPFKWVSVAYRPRIKALLEELSEEMGVQFIIVTHMHEIVTGTVEEL